MYQSKRSWLGTAVIGAFLLGMISVPSVYGQDFPISIKAYVFSLSAQAMKNYMKDGLTRAELTELQEKCFKTGCMLPKEEPVTLKDGENKVRVPVEGMADLQEAKEAGLVVLMFELERLPEGDKSEVTIARRSYVMAEKDDIIEEIRVKKGTWRMPENSPRYRYLDYRHAANFQFDAFVYELDVSLGAESQKVTLYLDLSE